MDKWCVSFVLWMALLAGAAVAAEPARYGSKDCCPSADRPIGFRGERVRTGKVEQLGNVRGR